MLRTFDRFRRAMSAAVLVPTIVLMCLIGAFMTRRLTATPTFTPGNLALLVAAASANNTTGSVVEINTTAAGQSAIQAISIPGTGTDAYRISGSASSTGYVSLSNDRTLLTFMGANNTNTSSNVNTLNPRGVFTVNNAGAIAKQTTYTGASGNQTRSATSLNNTNWFIGDQGGFYSNGTTAASPSGNIRGVKSFGGTVYALTTTATVPPVGVVSAPTAGTYSGLPGLPNSTSTAQDFYLVQSGDHGSSYDLLYVVSATTDTAGAIAKYSLVDTNANGILGDAGDLWTANGTYTTTFGGFGLAAADAGSGEVLYLTTGLGALTANKVLKVTDDAGYNAAINVTTANNVTLYTAPSGAIIKGLDFAPVAPTAPPAPTVSLSVSTNTATEAGQTVVTVTANASTAVSGDQTVSLSVTGTGITAGDYTLSSSTITIPNGTASGSVAFTVVDDAIVEGTEVATLTISNPSSGITLGSPVSRTISIIDNDHLVPGATPDGYTVESGTTLTVAAAQGVLANDTGGPLSVFSHTSTAHGTLSLNSDGSFIYTPAPGFFGTDTFSYSTSNATPVYSLQLFKTNLPPLATFGGVKLTGGAFGSALAPVPGSADEFFGLTDRGPNVDGPGGTKIEPLPSFTPSIGKFKFVGGQAVLEAVIPLMAPDGVTPFSGRVSPLADTGETITDLNGNTLAKDPYGFDSEGLVALADGTFWVSDEYGPFIVHFDAAGREIARVSPFDGSLPRELAARIVNRGMEGLAVTPDGSTLIGIMQSSLQQPDLAGFDAKKLTPLRIVTYHLSDGVVHEYLYLLDNPNTTKTAVSELTALSATTFLVDERDGNFPPGAYKRLFKIDISGATDVGPSSSVPGATYDLNSGLLIGGHTIEYALWGGGSTPFDTAISAGVLAGLGITPVSKGLYLDVGGLLDSVDPAGRFFSHDKIEGVAVANDGATVTLANDSDFGIDGVTNSTPPFQLHAKTTGAGVQDDGEFLVVDLVRSTAAVTITVVDTIAPETLLTSTPSNPTNSSNAGFAFSGADSGSGVASFACALDGGAFVPCASGVTYTGLADGGHTFAVRAVDAAGNVDATPETYAWSVDSTPPETVLDSTPASPTVNTNALFLFHGADSGTGVAGFECVLDGVAFGPCTSGAAHAGLADGSHTFAVRAVDAVGNVDASPAAFTWVVDTAGPSLTVSGNLVAEATGPGGALVSFAAPSAADDGSGVQSVVCNPVSGSLFAIGAISDGVTTVTCTATDNLNNSTTKTFTITVQDHTTPVVTPPPNTIVASTSSAGAVVTYAAATATDLVTTSLAAACLPASGSTFAIGTTTVTCTATDTHGNTGSAGFTVRVTPLNDKPPKVTAPKQVTEEASGPSGAVVTFNVKATDKNDGTLPVTCQPLVSGNVFPLGATVETCIAADSTGLTASASFTVTVRDTKAPRLTVPERQVVEATSPAGATVAFTVTATDSVAPAPAIVCLPASGSVFPLGRTTVTCTSTDASGNARSDTFVVNVRDTIAPNIVSTTPSSLVLPPTGGMVPVTFALVVTDAGDPAPACSIRRVTSNISDVDHNHVPDWQITGPLTVSLEAATRKFRDREYHVVIVCTDTAGNSSRERETVIVSHLTGN